MYVYCVFFERAAPRILWSTFACTNKPPTHIIINMTVLHSVCVCACLCVQVLYTARTTDWPSSFGVYGFTRTHKHRQTLIMFSARITPSRKHIRTHCAGVSNTHTHTRQSVDQHNAYFIAKAPHYKDYTTRVRIHSIESAETFMCWV